MKSLTISLIAKNFDFFFEFEVTLSSITTLRKARRIKTRNYIFRVHSARRVYRTYKNLVFWINSDIDNYIYYNRELFNKIRSLTTIKTAEITIGDIVVVESIEFIIFALKIDKKKILNIFIDVEYVSYFIYNFIVTSFFEVKNCEIFARKSKLIVIDIDNDQIFITRTR